MISDVVVTPLTATVSFADALARVKALAADFGVQNNEKISREIRRSENDPPNWVSGHSVTTGCRLDKETGIFIRIESATQTDHWYLSYKFYVSRLYAS